MTNIGQLVREARLRVGLSQLEVDTRIGYAGKFLTKVENNRHSPTIRSLEEIAEAMDLELVITFRPSRVK